MYFHFPTKEHLLDAIKIAGVSENIISELLQHIETLSLKSNQLLVKAGEVNTHLYYVLEGGFVCRFVSEDLEVERTINFYMNELHPIMACIDSYFTATKTMCELRAVADSKVLAIPKTVLDAFIERDKNLKTIFDTLLINALTEENDLKLKIIAYKPAAMYQYILQTFPVVIQKTPSKYIAELLGISAEWLSKLKAKQKFSG